VQASNIPGGNKFAGSRPWLPVVIGGGCRTVFGLSINDFRHPPPGHPDSTGFRRQVLDVSKVVFNYSRPYATSINQNKASRADERQSLLPGKYRPFELQLIN
jgi:hypothetical protein